MEVINRLPQEIRNEVWYQYAVIEFGIPLPEEIITFDKNGNTKKTKLPPRIQIPMWDGYYRVGQLRDSPLTDRARVFDLAIAKASPAFFREFIWAIHPFTVFTMGPGEDGEDFELFLFDLQAFYPKTKLPPWLQVRMEHVYFKHLCERQVLNPAYKDNMADIYQSLEKFASGVWSIPDPMFAYTKINWEEAYCHPENEGGDKDDDDVSSIMSFDECCDHAYTEVKIESGEIVNWWEVSKSDYTPSEELGRSTEAEPWWAPCTSPPSNGTLLYNGSV